MSNDRDNLHSQGECDYIYMYMHECVNVFTSSMYMHAILHAYYSANLNISHI